LTKLHARVNGKEGRKRDRW